MSCCHVPARPLRLQDCLERGLRTRRATPLSHRGAWIETPRGLRARFSLVVERAVIAEIRFEATPCATTSAPRGLQCVSVRMNTASSLAARCISGRVSSQGMRAALKDAVICWYSESMAVDTGR